MWLGVALPGGWCGFCAAPRIGCRKSGFGNCVLGAGYLEPALATGFGKVLGRGFREPGLGNQVRERGYGTGALGSRIRNQVSGTRSLVFFVEGICSRFCEPRYGHAVGDHLILFFLSIFLRLFCKSFLSTR